MVNLTHRQFLKLMVATLAGAAIPVARAQTKSINIGVILPLSGGSAEFGNNSLNGIKLAADDVNNAGGIKSLGGAKLNLVIADSTSNPQNAATAARRLIEGNTLSAVIGAYASALTLAVTQVTERAKMPLLTMSFTDKLTESGFQYLFQVVSKASTLGAAQVRYAVEILKDNGVDVSRPGMLYEDTAYGSSQAVGVREEMKKLGIKLALDESYSQGIRDASPLINKVKSNDVDLLFPLSYFEDSLLIIKSLRQHRISVPMVGGAGGYVIPAFHKALGDVSDGIMSIDTSNYDLKPEMTRRYQERYGQFMVHEALENAVAVSVIAEAMELAGDASAAAVTKQLKTATFRTGWSQAMTGGSVKFDKNGLNEITEPIMVQWQKADLVTIAPKKLAKGTFKRITA